MATGTYTQAPSGIASGHAQGILQTNQGDAVVWKISGGVGKNNASGGTFLGIMTFMTTSSRFSWLNDVIATYEGRGPPGYQEWSGIAQEWK